MRCRKSGPSQAYPVPCAGGSESLECRRWNENGIPRGVNGNGELPVMRGPGLRRTIDVRRVWRCPACGKESPTSGAVTSLRCRCETPGRFMQLMEPRRKVRPEMEPPDIYFECAPPDEADAAPAGTTAQRSEPPSEAVAAATTDMPTESPAVRGDVPLAETDVVTTTEADEAEADVPEQRGSGEPADVVVPTETSAGTAESSGETGGAGQKRKRKSRRGRRRRGRRGNRDSGAESGSGGPGPT